MKILIGCERSQIVTNAFRKLGHEAYSCDILPTEGNANYHIQDDILNHLDDGWDMAGFHPDCKNMTVSGARYFHLKKEVQKRDLDFVATLLKADIPRIYLENPVSIISTHIRKPEQIIQPWQFGEDASKTTCLWLKNLPKLKPTKIIKKKRYANQTPSGRNNLGPSKDRAYLRAKTYPGIAKAMAEQWGNTDYPLQTTLIGNDD